MCIIACWHRAELLCTADGLHKKMILGISVIKNIKKIVNSCVSDQAERKAGKTGDIPVEFQTKRRVRRFWDQNPCGSKHVSRSAESEEFFKEYDALRLRLHPYLVDVLPLSGFPGQRILEIGCGIGADAAAMASHGAEITAFDLSTVSVKLTRRRFKQYGLKGNFVVGDAENLPFRGNSHDCVVSLGVLHHTPDTAGAVDELYRVLRPRGRAIVMLYNRNSFRYMILYKILAATKKLQPDRLVAEEYDGKGNPLGKVFSRNEARSMFSGFSDVTFRVYNFSSYDMARVFDCCSPYLTSLAKRIVRRVPRLCYDLVSRVLGLDLYIFAVK